MGMVHGYMWPQERQFLIHRFRIAAGQLSAPLFALMTVSSCS